MNLSYPEWTGGWSTGPRLLVPLLPFAMLPVAGLLAVGGRWAAAVGVGLAVAGGALMLLFQGAGGGVPQYVEDPIGAVWSIWRGDPLPAWRYGRRFERTIVAWIWPGAVEGLPPRLRWVQFLPLVAFQVIAVGGMSLARHDEHGNAVGDPKFLRRSARLGFERSMHV